MTEDQGREFVRLAVVFGRRAGLKGDDLHLAVSDAAVRAMRGPDHDGKRPFAPWVAMYVERGIKDLATRRSRMDASLTRDAADFERLLPPERRNGPRKASYGDALTPRERSIVESYARSGTLAEAGKTLGIANQSMKNAMSVVNVKLGTTSYHLAILEAVRLGVVVVPGISRVGGGKGYRKI
jgi:DNA-binding CsgD family transcriptional regulator